MRQTWTYFLLMLTLLLNACATSVSNSSMDNTSKNFQDRHQFFSDYLSNEINSLGFFVGIVVLTWFLLKLLRDVSFRKKEIYRYKGSRILMGLGLFIITLELFKLFFHRIVDYKISDQTLSATQKSKWNDIGIIEGSVFGVAEIVPYLIYVSILVLIWSHVFPPERQRAIALTEPKKKDAEISFIIAGIFLSAIFLSVAPHFGFGKVSDKVNEQPTNPSIKSRHRSYYPPILDVQYERLHSTLPRKIKCWDGSKVHYRSDCPILPPPPPPPPPIKYDCWDGRFYSSKNGCVEKSVVTETMQSQWNVVAESMTYSNLQSFMNRFLTYLELSDEIMGNDIADLKDESLSLLKNLPLGRDNYFYQLENCQNNSVEDVLTKLVDHEIATTLIVEPAKFETVFDIIVVKPRHKLGAEFEVVEARYKSAEAFVSYTTHDPIFEERDDLVYLGKSGGKHYSMPYKKRIVKVPAKTTEIIHPAKFSSYKRYIMKKNGNGSTIPAETVQVPITVVDTPATVREIVPLVDSQQYWMQIRKCD